MSSAPATTIGDDVTLHANVTICDRCIVGPRSIVHSGVVIGADGFGMAEEGGRWLKIPQIGRVVIGADVEIGANTTIDRGAIDDTVIENDVKLDNLIQIGHNCRIGAHTAIAGCVGIAGSTRIGRNCKIGGAAMLNGHIDLCDGVIISPGTGVMNSIDRPGRLLGFLARNAPQRLEADRGRGPGDQRNSSRGCARPGTMPAAATGTQSAGSHDDDQRQRRDGHQHDHAIPAASLSDSCWSTASSRWMTSRSAASRTSR